MTATSTTFAGELDRRLVIEAPDEAADGAGGVTRAYESIATVWAKVTPLAAHSDVAAASLGAVVRTRITIRAGLTLTPAHRFREGARLYRIVALRDSADRRFIEIDAEERAG